MSVMIDTPLGEVVVDLFCDEAPLAAKNFLKLCKIKYYNGCLFYNVQQNFMIQTGDPTATGKGGTSVYGLMYGEQARFFEDEISATSRKHDEAGLLSMANMGTPNTNGSQFFFSMRGDDMQHLDGKHTVFAKVMEGMETLEKINSQFCDDNGRPYRDIRILHTYVLDDPFDDPPQLVVPDESPVRDRPEEERISLRLGALDEVSLEVDEKAELEREKQLREKTARSNAVVLEMIGDLPDADMKPPENVLFVCKLNPVTTDDDLEIIFTRFGTCRAEICRDHVTGDSLNYAFVEFEAIESCEEAYKKMNNVLIDDRRIRVDFSQSVAKEWSKYKGRAQGGQKLASGKGGRPAQQRPAQQQQHRTTTAAGGGTTYANNNNKNAQSAVGQPRRSKWGNVPTGGGTPLPPPTTAAPSVSKGSFGNGERTRRGERRHDDDDDDAGGGGEGHRRDDHRRSADWGAEGGGGRKNGTAESSRLSRGGRVEGEQRERRFGGGGGGGREEDGTREGTKRRGDDRRDERSRGSRDRDGGGGNGRRRQIEHDEDGRKGGGRTKDGSSSGRHHHQHHHRSDDRKKNTDGGRRKEGRSLNEESDGGGRSSRARGVERSRRQDRSRSRSRERPRGRGGSQDREGSRR